MKVEIKVTAGHIRRGLPNKCRACPIALAACEAFQLPVGHAMVTAHWLMLGDVVFQEFRLPYDATDFTQNFDNGRPVEPFSFTVGLPDAIEFAPA